MRFQNFEIIIENIFKYGAGEAINKMRIIESKAGNFPKLFKIKLGIDWIFCLEIFGAKKKANPSAAK